MIEKNSQRRNLAITYSLHLHYQTLHVTLDTEHGMNPRLVCQHHSHKTWLV